VDRQPALAQHLERRRRAVLQQVVVDVEQRLAILALEDAVGRPDLFEERGNAGVPYSIFTPDIFTIGP
jgi:hypothetical protein